MNTVVITETGTYLDNHRGHYITRDAIEFAIGYGFIIGPLEKFVLDHYEDHGHDEDYPFDCIVELCDEAMAWLNCGENTGLDRPIKGQNNPPAIPADTYWSFNDGDFGLWTEDELID